MKTSAATRAGSSLAVLLAAHAVVNLRLLRRAPSSAEIDHATLPPISVLVPVRNEEARIIPCLTALLSAVEHYGPGAELIVLDDESTDNTFEITQDLVESSGQARVSRGVPLPRTWLGKPHACRQLAEAAHPDSEILVFVDADVVLEPDALLRTVAHLRETGLDLVSPYPRQQAETPGERLVQPLLQWSWATLLPLRLAERSRRRSMTAANGQLLAVRTEAYRRSGGHAAKPNAVLDDIELLKSLKDNGFHGIVTDGTDIATCRMYEDWPTLREGYRKSLWAITGSPHAAFGLCSAFLTIYVVPPLAWLRNPRSRVAAAGTLAAVANRAAVAHRVGGRVWPDSLTHPFAILAFTSLTVRSWVGRRAGSLRWKSRPL